MTDTWTCTRCGLHTKTSANQTVTGECTSCRSVQIDPSDRVMKIGYREIASRTTAVDGDCYAWLGAFADDDQPVDANGFAIEPGIRRCGHADCVRPSHITPLETMLDLLVA